MIGTKIMISSMWTKKENKRSTAAIEIIEIRFFMFPIVLVLAAYTAREAKARVIARDLYENWIVLQKKTLKYIS